MSGKLCLCLTGKTLSKNEELLKMYIPPAELAELRVDMLERGEYERIPNFTKRQGVPLILTLRRPAEGGFFKGSEKERMGIVADILRQGRISYIDLEEDGRGRYFSEVQRIAEEKGSRIIRSLHNYQGIWTKEVEKKAWDLFSRFTENDIIKIAHYCRTIKELKALLDFSDKCQEQYSQRDVIIIGMGDYGIPSRILSSRFGSFLSFVSPAGRQGELDQEERGADFPTAPPPAAPGQLDPATMEDLYGYHNVNKETSIFGIIGNPVLHSRSPEIHNRAFRHMGLNAVYIPFTVDNPEEFFPLAKALRVKGFSVTLPHKETVIPLLHSMSEEVQAIGSCNTVVRREGGYRGLNYDYLGFLDPLQKVLAGEEGSRKKTLVIGAGGAARAVLYGLQRIDTEIYLTNRTEEKGRALSKEFNCEFCSYDPEEINSFSWDIIVQTTSLGMHPHTENMPLEGIRFTGNEIVYDCIYTPPRTLFLQKAEEAGAKTINGLGMLLGQAYHQFREFTGYEYPPNVSISRSLMSGFHKNEGF